MLIDALRTPIFVIVCADEFDNAAEWEGSANLPVRQTVLSVRVLGVQTTFFITILFFGTESPFLRFKFGQDPCRPPQCTKQWEA